MKQRSLFVFCLIFGIAGFTAAQTKSVTNKDLEKYRNDREKAESEYRRNYAKLGLPSPEELERRREQDRVASEKLSTELRASRLERERLEAERLANAGRAVYFQYVPVDRDVQDLGSGYFWSYGRRYRYPARQLFSQPGYYAGGQFWPTPVRTPQRLPIWLRPR